MMRRGRRGALTAIAVVVGLASCGSETVSTSGTAGTGTSAGPDSSRCELPTLPGGTWVDTEGKAHGPRTAPTPRPLPTPERSIPPSTYPGGMPTEPEVAARDRQRAIEAAGRDPIIGTVVSDGNATLTSVTPWLGQHGEPIGVVLDYRFEHPVDLPRGHGDILQAAFPDSGIEGTYDTNGLPTKVAVGSAGVWSGTEWAWVFVDTEAGEVYAVQRMNGTAVQHPC